MSRVFWDTNLFIYLLEDDGERGARVTALRERMMERGDELITSALTLGEVLVRPIEAGDLDLARQYEHAITRGATVEPFGPGAARVFAEIRADRSIGPPDAIQLACASAAGVNLFITNDDRLSRKTIPGIDFIQPLDRSFL